MYGPTDLELAAGTLYGADPSAEGSPRVEDGIEPLAALESAALPALERPPCLVTFSGGRDSSSVLAAATRVARREALDPPVPITFRFPDAPTMEESEWQERVVRHLGLTEWETREIGEELDVIGPTAGTVLRRHGVLYPFNTFAHLPLLEAARGGSVLTGIGGDHVFLTWRWRVQADLLARRRPPVLRDVLRLAYAASPPPLRARWERHRRAGTTRSWLRPDVSRAVDALDAAERAAQPVRWREWIRWRTRRRDLAASLSSFGHLARDTDTLLLHPLVDPGFIAAVARAGGRLGLGDRTAAMRTIFAEALPDELLARSTKALFGEAFWRRESRDFAERWEGSGVDERLVDPNALRDEWLQPEPDARSAMLLQSAWLRTQLDAPAP